MAGDYPNAKQVSLTDEALAALKAACKKRGKTMVFLMREYIEKGALADLEDNFEDDADF